MPLDNFSKLVEEKVKEQIDEADSMVVKILDLLLKNTSLLLSLIKHHRDTFINLYRQNNKGKDKHLHFQLEWHRHCSVFLLPKDSTINCVFPDKEIHKGVHKMRETWQHFCDTCPEDIDKESYSTLMILQSY